MFKKKDKLRVGRPKLADSNLKKMSLLISAICFVMVIGLIFGGLLDLNIIGNTHKLKAEADISTLCTSIPDSLKYDENTNPYGFKDVEFFSGVLEYSRISGSNNYVYNDSKYCDTITKEDLEKIDDLRYSNNTISSANGIQYLTNLERLDLGTAADIPNYNITSIDLSHNTKLYSVDLSGLLNIKDFDFSNNPELSNILIGRSLYPTSYNINSLIIKNNSKLKTITNAFNTSYGVASILTGSINNLVIENTPNLQMEERVTDLKVKENISLINTKTSLLRLIYNNNNNVSKVLLNLKSIYLKDLVRDNFSVLNVSNLENLESLYIDNSALSSLEIKKTSSLKKFYINPKKDSLSTLKMINFSNDDINIKDYKKIYTLTISNDNNLFNFNDIDLSNYPNLGNLTLKNLNDLYNNKNIKLNNLNLKEKDKLSKLELSGFDIDSLDLSSNNRLAIIYLNKNNINNIYLPDKVIYSVDILDSSIKNFNLKDSKQVKVIDSNIYNFDLSNNSALYNLLLVNTDVKKLDLSNNESLKVLTVYNNSLNTIYMNKNSKENISDYLKINDKYGITYELENSDVIKIDQDVIVPLKTGDVTIKVNHNDSLRSCNKEELLENIKNKEYDKSASSNIKYPLAEINVHVYDVISSKYNIDDKTKVIDLKKNNIDLNEIKLGIDSLAKEISGNKLYLKDTSGNIIDEYTLVNKKEAEKESIKEEVKTTTKKKANSKKSSAKKTTTTKKASETTTTTIKSENDKENTKVVTNEKVVEKITYKSNDMPLIIINIVEGILLLVLAILFIKSMRKSK